MSSRRLLLIAAVLAALIAAIFIPPLLLSKDKLLELAKAAIREQTGAALAVEGEVDLELLPRIRISLGHVSLIFPEQEQTSLQVESLQLALQWLPLLSGKVEIELLTLGNSILELGNAEKTAPTVIALSRIQARGFNLDARPIELEASISTPGEPPLEVQLDGSLRFDQTRQVVVLDAVAAEITGLTPRVLRLQTQGEVDVIRQIATLQLALELAEANGEGSLRYSALESPMIDTTLHFDHFDPALLALAGPDAASEVQGHPDGGDDPLPLEALRTIDTRISLSIDKSLLAGHVVENLQLALQARDGLINIESLTATLYDGQLALEGSFDARQDSATLATSGGIAGLDIASALTATRAEPIAAGRVNLDWQLTGEGGSQNELLAGMSGPITLTTADVVLQNLGIEKMLCQAVALSNQETLTATFPDSTRFQVLAADIQLENGRAIMRPLRAELAHIILSGNGDYELLSGDFRASFKGRLSPELETLDPACRVSKRLAAIKWPVNCKGNMAGAPASWCSVDTQEILEDLAKDEVQRKLQKKAGKLLDKLFN